MQILESLTEDDPSGEANYLRGELLFQQQNVSAAREAYERALQRQPNHLNALYGMVKTSAYLNDLEAGQKDTEKFERLQAVFAELNQQRRASYDDLTELRRQAAQTCTDAGAAYQRHDRVVTAEQLWQRAADLDPQNTACRTLLTRHYEATKQYARTIPLYRALIELQPTNLANYERLGIRLASDGDFAAAEKIFQAMTKVPPNPARGYRMLAKLYLNSDQQLERAWQLAKESVQQDPVADSHFVLGWALAKNKQFAAARAALQRALELDGSNALYQKLYRSLPPDAE
jgi:tetratricopeptide (TPR) repeat protein